MKGRMNVRLIVTFLLGCLLSTASLAAPVPSEAQLRQQLQQAEANKGAADQTEIVEELQSALNAMQERKASRERAAQYQRVIDDFPKLVQELRRQITAEDEKPSSIAENQSVNDLEQQILQTSSQLLEQARQLQQEQERLREISDSLGQLPQQQTEASRSLSEIESRIQSLGSPTTPLGQAQLAALQAESTLRKSRVDELELAQLSASSRQELSRLRAELYKNVMTAWILCCRGYAAISTACASGKRNRRWKNGAAGGTKRKLALRHQFTADHQPRAVHGPESAGAAYGPYRFAAASGRHPYSAGPPGVEHHPRAGAVAGGFSGTGETLRAQVARLPEMPKPQLLDSDMAQLRVQRLHFEELINKQHDVDQAKQDDGTPLTSTQQRILTDQLRTQRDLLTSLISGCDTQILELTKLKVANNQLQDALSETREAAHRYLFWVADVDPITFPTR